MARIFLDKAIEGDLWTGYRLYDIYFNDATKQVEADFVGPYAIGTPSGVVNDFGDVIYDECFGFDKYQVIKRQLNPFGEVVVQQNSSSCRSAARSSALYRFNDAGGAKFGATAADTCAFIGFSYIYWYGDLEVGTEVYDTVNDDPLTYDSAGWFRIGKTAYQIDATSTIIAISVDECGTPTPLPEPDPLPEPEVTAAFQLPTASSVTFRKEGTPLFVQEPKPGLLDKDFYQVWKAGNTMTVQFGSSYATNQVRLVDLEGGVDVVIPANKVKANLNQTLEVPGFGVNHPEVVGLQIWFPNQPFPAYGKVGNTINLVSDQVSQQVQITNVQDGKGEAKGYRVMVVNYLVPITGVLSLTVTGTYNIRSFDIYEAAIELATPGLYRLRIEVSDTVFTDTFAQSEPIEVRGDLEDYQQVTYTNDDDAYGCYYGSGIIHERWIKSRLYQAYPGGEKTLNRETDAKLVKLDEFVTNSLEWEIFQIPPYLVTQLGIALGHDTFKLNGVSMQSEEGLEPEYYIPEPMANATVRLEDVEFTENNRDESEAVDSTDSFLLIESDNKLKIKS